MAKSIVKNEQQAYVCYDKIGLRVKKIDAILGSLANIFRSTYVIT
jgi:hypothetical protein